MSSSFPGPDAFASSRYRWLLLLTAGLGGLLYGIDVGIIAGALPYMEATFREAVTGQGLSAGQLSIIVASVLLGSVLSTLFAGLLADYFGRKPLMIASGVLFALSIPLIALAQGFMPLVLGRLLQGVSAGLIGVVIPLYLAECLGAEQRGKGTGIFQWMLTLGIVVAAVIAYLFSIRAEEIGLLRDTQQLFNFQDLAWRSIFWASLPPGVLFIIGALMVSESPRWLVRHGRLAAARVALLRSHSPLEADRELEEMARILASERTGSGMTIGTRDTLFQRRYVIPFVLACVILACNQATGINSIIGYNATILIQAGLNDAQAHLGYVILTAVNFLFTMVGVVLVDRKGRKFLLSVGTSGIIVSLVGVGLLFRDTERQQVDCAGAMQALVVNGKRVEFPYDQAQADRLLASGGPAGAAIQGRPTTLSVIYSCGDFVAASPVLRSSDVAAKIAIDRDGCLPSGRIASFFVNPFADLAAAQAAPLVITHALIAPVPSTTNGWLIAACIWLGVACFAIGPGVCVWLALSELMPTRIRSNGMSIALLINQAVSTTIAGVFLPTVGTHGYAMMFFLFAGCTVVYFITAVFFLPETKGRTLEEIEQGFANGKAS